MLAFEYPYIFFSKVLCSLNPISTNFSQPITTSAQDLILICRENSSTQKFLDLLFLTKILVLRIVGFPKSGKVFFFL